MVLAIVLYHAPAHARAIDEIINEEKSILDALDRTVFEARRARLAVETAVKARERAEARLETTTAALITARQDRQTAFDSLRDTLRLMVASRPAGVAANLLLGMDLEDDSRRSVMLERLTARQAAILDRLIDSAVAAETAEFKAAMERANAHAAAMAGREAMSRLKTETEDRQRILLALQRDKALNVRHARELGDAYQRFARSIRAQLTKSAGAIRFDRLKGRLRWPLADAVVAVPFGDRAHLKFGTITPHPGLTLTYDRGHARNVRAIAFGKVVFNGIMRGYGDTVVLDHASGYYSVYAGLASVGVGIDDIIHEGNILGMVERRPGEEDIRLYFEIRKGRDALDPLPYLVGSR